MAQRSQIYLVVNGFLVLARDYSWNYGERMVSRARYGIEHINTYMDNSFWGIQKMCRIFDTNFDMKDVVVSSNLYHEAIEMGTKKDDLISTVVYDTDCNDGKLFVSIDATKKQIKYCFTDSEITQSMDPAAYMAWDLGKDWANCYQEKGYLDSDDIQVYINNANALVHMARLMSQEELHTLLENSKLPNEEYFKI